MNAQIDKYTLPDGYNDWRKRIENLIEKAKLNADIHIIPWLSNSASVACKIIEGRIPYLFY